MKFELAVVMLIIAIGAQAGYVPVPITYQNVVAYHRGPYLAHGPSVTTYAHSGSSAVHVSPYAVSAEGTYVARTAGAVHTAPLPGHTQSIYSINDAPAPGHSSWAYGTYAAPPAVTYNVPSPVHIAVEGTYVAKTPGAVHTAPLPGHIQSAYAINDAPAPGTYY